MTPEQIIKHFSSQKHPEGGFFRETYRGDEIVHSKPKGDRSSSTLIYYLLSEKEISHFHKVISDEIWAFHAGTTIEILEIDRNGGLVIHQLGLDIKNEEVPHLVIKRDHWFAARVKNGKGFGFVSCIVAPGFEFKDFELGKKELLIEQFPHLTFIIEKHCL